MTRVRFSCSWFPVALVCIGTSCAVSDAVHDDTYEERALIVYYGDTSSIVAPDTVLRGQRFTVAFQTFAGGCTRSVARTHVATSGLASVIQPYNRTTGAQVCTRDLLWLRHVAQVRIDQAGIASLRVIGEQRGASTGATNGPAELTKNVIVR